MAKQVQMRRATTSVINNSVGAEGEIFVDTTKDAVVVMDGSTLGGHPLAREDLSNAPNFVGATAITDGAAGKVPAPLTGDQSKFLKADGTWSSIDGAAGPMGPSGDSAYEIAVANGFVGDEIAWLGSLTGPQGPAGVDGASGRSAYQFALDNGFEGSEEQWLASLVGPMGPQGPAGADGIDGIDGEDGKSAFEIAVENGFVGTEEEWLETLVGEQGPAGDPGGPPGPAGPAGIDGKSAYELALDDGFVGDLSAWLDSLIGEQGPQGIQGIQGPQGLQGEAGPQGIQGIQGETGPTGPQGATGADGKSAYEVAVDEGFVGDEAAWLASLVGPQGPQGIQGVQGPQGEQGIQGPAGPAGADGEDGKSAYEVAVENGFVGDEAAWLASLVGPQGPQGIQGETGPQGIQGPAGANGNDGADGKSAYEVAVDEGFVGDEAVWLASLVGPQGPQGVQGPQGEQGIQGPAGTAGTNGVDGEDGDSAYEIAVANGFVGDEVAWLASLVGPQGPAGNDGATGATGPAGANGLDGKTILNGAGTPSNGIGQDGDFFIDTTNKMIYGPKTAGDWGTGTSLVGPQGPAGDDGIDGLDGFGVPMGGTTGQILAKNSNDDYDTEWIDAPNGGVASVETTDSTSIDFSGNGTTLTPLTAAIKISADVGNAAEIKTDGLFVSPGATGPQGPAGNDGADGATGPAGADGVDGVDGKTILNGTTAPDNGLGVDGDFYLNTTNSDLYGPKTAGVWGSPVSLIGPQGPQGIQGIQGIQGVAGTDGINGTDGEDGRTILNGTIAPDNGLGLDGDFYLNTSTSQLYGPKTSGVWGSPVSLIGPQGPAGNDGLDGETPSILATYSTNADSGTINLVLADADKFLRYSSASAKTVIIPNNSSVAFPFAETGSTTLYIMNAGAGTLTINPDTGVTINKRSVLSNTLSQWASATLIKVGENTWDAFGDFDLA